ncbi:MAG: hypothetical protein AAGG45_09825 [Pseudomonadota bacterium]
MKIIIEIDSSRAGALGDPHQFDQNLREVLATSFAKHGLPDRISHETAPAPETALGLFEAISWIIEYHTEITVAVRMGRAVINQITALYSLYGKGRKVTISIGGTKIELDKHQSDIEALNHQIEQAFQKAKLETKS